MSEQLTFQPPQEAPVFNADDIDSRQGIEDGDLELKTDKLAEWIISAHMSEYDNYVGAAQYFVGETLGMKDVQPTTRTAVLSTEIAESWGVGSNGGHYLPELDVAYVFEQSSGRPKTDKLILASSLVHELAHSATVTPENVLTESTFYHEAIAGMAEYFALKNLAEAGKFDPAPDTTITRIIDGEEVTIVIPGEFRRVDSAEVSEDKADSTQALVAAMVVGIGLKVNGQSARDILAAANRNDSTAYDAMREAIVSIDPSLVDDILQTSGTTDEIIKVAHRAQQAVGMI